MFGMINIGECYVMGNRETYENSIISKLKSWDLDYTEIENDNILKHVYDLYENGNMWYATMYCIYIMPVFI